MTRSATTLVIVVVLLLSSGCLAHRWAAPQSRQASTLSAEARTRLGIPAGATVLALPGADLHLRNGMPEEFGGAFSRPPYTMNVIDYPRDLTKASIPTGVANIDEAIRATPGTLIVLAYSQGAQVASEWMRQHAQDPTVPGPDRLTFVLFGNPLRASGGEKVGHPTSRTTGLATPTDTPWHIVDVARRYDGFADSPQDKGNTDAVRNADLGKLFIHPHYEGVDLNDPSLQIWNRGNTTFVLTNEPVLPILEKAPPDPDQVDSMRSRIESAYHRS
ncbi:PE-PPE domain-containing protein [Mycolicibacterium chubuense]|uniref:Putative PPE family protein PPE42 n=1 Tax=Mycolicibacterium chubuense TaxID=1800 RepID=A0A0J6ZII2_MYCCU|nr:PE-PPE domain-containing protein [Mycolicibacterium chubuense]KMO84706.1 putative PPE family protein PPE42 [Mycolicibacterium chubuense]ORA45249.1 PE-PPE domain-containing protein [Mycolicibacterium chubuense]SPY00768.1 PE-PPE domain-containing protein [Mycolicibacterium chubuense]